MTTLDLKLGPPEVSLISPQTFGPKPPQTPRRNRVAVLVAHGMGQQVPYETIDGVAQATQRGAQDAGAAISSSVIRTVRLGTQNKDDIEAQLVRAECEVADQNGAMHEVHIYESYWAPLTEGKVTAGDVVRFLFSSGWNGIWNTTARTYRRWMFGRERQFTLPTELLTLVFLGIMLLLLALVFINTVLAAAAASHAIGRDNAFPSGLRLVKLTWDFVTTDIAALLIVLGILVGKIRVRMAAIVGSFLLGLSALGILVSAFFMLAHLQNWRWAEHVVPDNRWPAFVTHWPFLVVLLWAIEFWAARTIRQFLIQYVGDVAAYIAAHSASKFWETRQQIWKAAIKVVRAVYRARTADNTGFLYDKLIVLGHSLGSVIGYDVLNGLLLEEQLCKQSDNELLQIADRTRLFLTFGSPLDKTAFLFRTQKDMRSEVREVGAAAVQPLIADYRNRPHEWVNLWSPFDIISGHLDYYDPPNVENAKHKAHYLEVAPDPRAIRNYIDPDARTPLAAHVEYWNGKLLAQHLYRGIIS
jgi:hypothetical protein